MTLLAYAIRAFVEAVVAREAHRRMQLSDDQNIEAMWPTGGSLFVQWSTP